MKTEAQYLRDVRRLLTRAERQELTALKLGGACQWLRLRESFTAGYEGREEPLRTSVVERWAFGQGRNQMRGQLPPGWRR